MLDDGNGAEDLPDFGDPDEESDEPNPTKADEAPPPPAAAVPAASPSGVAAGFGPVATTTGGTQQESRRSPVAPPAAAAAARVGGEPSEGASATTQTQAAATGSKPARDEGATKGCEAEDPLPGEADKEAWAELLRDSHMRQLREAAQLGGPELPPFPRVFNHSWPAASSSSQASPSSGSCPRQALNMQMQIVRGMRWEGEPGGYGPARWDREDRWDSWRGQPYGQGGGGWGSWGGQRGSARPSWAHSDMPSSASALLPQLMDQLQASGVGAKALAGIREQAQSGQLNTVLAEVAKKLAAHRAQFAASRAAESASSPGASVVPPPRPAA